MQFLVDFLEEQISLSPDRAMFLICIISCFPLGWGLRRLLFKNTSLACLYIIFWGFCFGFYCFKEGFMHPLLLSAVCYPSLYIVPKRFVGHFTMLLCLLYLSYAHYSIFIKNYGVYRLDFTGCMMILVQKLSYLGYEFQDDQKKTFVNPIKYLAFCFFYPSMLFGPSFSFSDFKEYLSLKEKRIKKPRDLCYLKPCLLKLAQGMFYVFLHHFLSLWLPFKTVLDASFVSSTSYLRYAATVFAITHARRFQYYGAFMLGEALCNSAVLGYKGQLPDGTHDWSLLRSVDVIGFETATNYKYAVDAWNIYTTRWLRFVCYNRLPNFKVLGTFVLSAYWHGFYTGYYASFVSAAFAVHIVRLNRRFIRPYFVTTSTTRFLYHLVTWAINQLFLDYFSVSFIFMNIQDSIIIWRNLGFVGHKIYFVCLFLFQLLRLTHYKVKSN